MKKVIGPADEFYRVRLFEIICEFPAELDWKEGISYFPPPPEEGKSLRKFLIEFVDIENKRVYPWRYFVNKAEALKAFEQAQEDLTTLTKSRLEKKYLFLPKNI